MSLWINKIHIQGLKFNICDKTYFTLMQITMGFLRIKKNTHNINWIFLNPIKYNIKSKSHQCKNFRLGEPSNKNLTFLAEMSAIFVFVRGGLLKFLLFLWKLKFLSSIFLSQPKISMISYFSVSGFYRFKNLYLYTRRIKKECKFFGRLP